MKPAIVVSRPLPGAWVKGDIDLTPLSEGLQELQLRSAEELEAVHDDNGGQSRARIHGIGRRLSDLGSVRPVPPAKLGAIRRVDGRQGSEAL